MTAEGLSLGATILLMAPMIYFAFVSLTFFLRRLDDPVVSWMLRGLFSVYFAAVMLGCLLAMAAFAAAGRPVIAAALAVLLALDHAGRRFFLRSIDAAVRDCDAGEVQAVRGMRRAHLGGIAWNGAQLVAVAACVPHVFPGP